MYTVPTEILQKHSVALEAARSYWVLHRPTGLSDSYFNELEEAARQDGLELRDYVCQEIQGTRAQNADYIPKVAKEAVPGSMMEAVRGFTERYTKENPGKTLYWIPKYDGSSLAAYYDTNTGRCVKVVTVGGSNLGNLGIDQTEKFAKFFPVLPGTGIKALQAECLVSLEHGFGESSRQKANGLVNAAYEPMSFDAFIGGSVKTRTDKDYQKYLSKFRGNLEGVREEIDKYINIRCFRYFIDDSYTKPSDYRMAMETIPYVINGVGDYKFSGGLVMTLPEMEQIPEQVEKDIWVTPTGTFLVDGLVAYTQDGECIEALKYKDAGRGESVLVKDIRWNNQITKGKDSWSANAIIEPVTIRGSIITKPTIGSVKKMITGNISPGARVTLILANSTIPTISETLEPGDGDFKWPTCSCGYQMSGNDTYGSLLKCGNPKCTERLERMKRTLTTVKDIHGVNLDKLLIIDRVKLIEKPGYQEVLGLIEGALQGDCLDDKAFFGIVSPLLTTDLQLKNLALVSWPAATALMEWIKTI